jgi:heme O synthase-like polyprenyltransferase
MKRRSFDFLFASGLAVLPWVIGIRRIEAGRMLILACLLAAVAVLTWLRVIPAPVHRAATAALAVTLLALAWFQSFPAGNHSAEIGLYILFGAIILTGMPFAELLIRDPLRN